MGLAIKHIPHYTYDDYCQWEGRWELIDGIPYAMSPAPVYKHQAVLLKIGNQFSELLNKCKNCNVIIAPFDWKINNDTVLQPDVMVVCGEINQKYLTIPPQIIFEILSPSTSQKDKVVKYEIFQTQGVKYYVLIDTETQSGEIFELKNNSYKKPKEVKNDKATFNISSCKINFDFGKIW